jgi:hypothetical protein
LTKACRWKRSHRKTANHGPTDACHR